MTTGTASIRGRRVTAKGVHATTAVAYTPPVSSVRRVLVLRQQHQRGLDALADVLGVREPELQEDRVDVLLDRARGEKHGLGDGAVALALRDLRQHFALA